MYSENFGFGLGGFYYWGDLFKSGEVIMYVCIVAMCARRHIYIYIYVYAEYRFGSFAYTYIYICTHTDVLCDTKTLK